MNSDQQNEATQKTIEALKALQQAKLTKEQQEELHDKAKELVSQQTEMKLQQVQRVPQNQSACDASLAPSAFNMSSLTNKMGEVAGLNEEHREQIQRLLRENEELKNLLALEHDTKVKMDALLRSQERQGTTNNLSASTKRVSMLGCSSPHAPPMTSSLQTQLAERDRLERELRDALQKGEDLETRLQKQHRSRSDLERQLQRQNLMTLGLIVALGCMCCTVAFLLSRE